MSVYDLYQSYLNQMQAPAPAASSNILDPSYLLYLQQQQGGGGVNDDGFTNVIDTTNNAGITSISDAFSAIQGQISPGSIIGGVLGGIPGALIGRGIGNLISNIQNPNTTMFGQPTEKYQQQLEKMAQKKLDFQQFTGGGGGGHPGGAAAAAGAAAQAADDAAAGAGGY
jgi:hypothetical protein